MVPPGTRTERVARTKAVSDVAQKLAIDSVACHIGFVPEDADDPLYHQLRDVTREVCDYCGANGQSFTLETGQEPAKVLLQFIADVDCSNLKINFDPANMILYGTGDPVEALDVLAHHVVSAKLKEIGYRGVLSIEREGVDSDEYARDIRKAIALLERLRKPYASASAPHK